MESLELENLRVSSIGVGGTGAFFGFLWLILLVEGVPAHCMVSGFICWCEGVPAQFDESICFIKLMGKMCV